MPDRMFNCQRVLGFVRGPSSVDGGVRLELDPTAPLYSSTLPHPIITASFFSFALTDHSVTRLEAWNASRCLAVLHALFDLGITRDGAPLSGSCCRRPRCAVSISFSSIVLGTVLGVAISASLDCTCASASAPHQTATLRCAASGLVSVDRTRTRTHTPAISISICSLPSVQRGPHPGRRPEPLHSARAPRSPHIVRLQQARVAGQRPPHADTTSARRTSHRTPPPPAPSTRSPSADRPAASPSDVPVAGSRPSSSRCRSSASTRPTKPSPRPAGPTTHPAPPPAPEPGTACNTPPSPPPTTRTASSPATSATTRPAVGHLSVDRVSSSEPVGGEHGDHALRIGGSRRCRSRGWVPCSRATDRAAPACPACRSVEHPTEP